MSFSFLILFTPYINYISRYNGRKTGVPDVFPPEMEEACKIIEEIVNKELRKRTHTYKLEWGRQGGNEPLWRANVAASNCYQGGKESVGLHSDQLTYLGPYPTIASLSLGKSLAYISTENEISYYT